MSEGVSGEHGLDPLVGAILDKDYRVGRRIGVGGMSVVYLVEHQRLHKSFAAKLLHVELSQNREALARLEIEAKAASQLEHENIVRVTDYGVAADKRPYIIMELLKGRTLDEHIVEQALTLQEAVLVIVSVCRALACAHADGIVHRDIKPDNIFLTAKPNGQFGVKVLDFGIAKAPVATGKVTKHGQTIGSPHYMAPEACRGDEVDHRADIYSVGVLMYLLFTGRLPYHDENFLKLLQMQVSDPVTPPSEIEPSVSAAMEAVIMRALAKNPDDRFLSVEQLLHDFELALPEGANDLLVAQSRVSTPIPISRTPLPGVLPPTSPTGRTPARTSTPPANPVVPVQAKSSRTPMLVGVLLLLIGGVGVAIWAVMHKSGGDTVAQGPTPPAVAPLPTPGSNAVGDGSNGSGGSGELGPRKVGPAVQDPDPQPSTKKVHVAITTRPAHAMVRVNGIELGHTPLQTDVAPVDDATVEISSDGYDTVSRHAALVADFTLELDLVKSKASAQVHVTTTTHHDPNGTKPPHNGKPPAGDGSGSAQPHSTNPDLDIRTHR